MSKITEITITVGQTIQIKQYEPRVYTASVKMSVEPTEDADKVFKIAREKVNQEVEQYFKGLNNSPKA